MTGFTVGVGVGRVAVWGIAVLFVVGALVRTRHERLGRLVEAGGWIAFGAFWLVALPQVPVIAHSPLSAFETLTSTKGRLYVAFLAGPLCAYLAYLTWRDHRGFRTLARVVGVAALVYVPALTVRAVRATLIYTTVHTVGALVTALDESPVIVPGAAGFRNTFQFTMPAGHSFSLHVLLACTGIGSIAIATGLIVGVDGALRQKLRVLGVALPCIYVANIARIVFIGVASGDQLLQVAPHVTMSFFGTTDPAMVSYYLSDHVISQLCSVAVLVGLLIYAFQSLPSLAVLVEDLVEALTRTRPRIRAGLR